jgi:DNA-binding response OmpR family regulator
LQRKVRASGASARYPRQVISVLVVEDSSDLREMYQEILSMGGHAVHLSETAAEGIAALEGARPDVVLLDLGIAGGVGGLLAALRPETRVILASGARDLPERAAALGAAAYLLKPFTPEQLIAAVETVVPPR